MVDASGGPRRKYYRLTADGERQLTARTAAWRGLVAAVDPLVTRDVERDREVRT
jgi:DNA-binding PadR family transcriptional regulator